MQIHSVKREHPNTKSRRVGRGGKRGKTAGRGTKGQKARAGRKLRPESRDLIKKLPKRRGHGKNRARTVNSGRVKFVVVNLSKLDEIFAAGEKVAPSFLVSRKVISKKGGKIPSVKILGDGELSKKFIISKCLVSKSAKEKIEKAGGKIV